MFCCCSLLCIRLQSPPLPRPQVGRKLLLLWGAAGMCLATLSAGLLVATVLRGDGGPATQSPAQLAVGYLVVILVLFYVFNFAYSWGWVHQEALMHLSLVVYSTCCMSNSLALRLDS